MDNPCPRSHKKGVDMTLHQCIERGKQLIADYQWAYVCQDSVLMEKYARERAEFELSLEDKYGEDFACDYFNGLYE